MNGESCAPGTAIHCLNSQVCTQNGQCTLDKTLSKCVASSDKDCEEAINCKVYGNCAVNAKGDCRPASDAHCLASRRCQFSGRCRFMVTSWDGPTCLAGSASDCIMSDGCTYYKKCTYNNGYCIEGSS